MNKPEDKNTRYYIDLDLNGRKIIGWDYDQRETLVKEDLPKDYIRIYITKGQFNKLKK
jgi:hypothetical protein